MSKLDSTAPLEYQAITKFLTDLANAPNGQIAKTETEKIRKLIGKTEKEIVEGMDSILFDCCEYALASDFAMVCLQAARNMADEIKQ